MYTLCEMCVVLFVLVDLYIYAYVAYGFEWHTICWTGFTACHFHFHLTSVFENAFQSMVFYDFICQLTREMCIHETAYGQLHALSCYIDRWVTVHTSICKAINETNKTDFGNSTITTQHMYLKRLQFPVGALKK